MSTQDPDATLPAQGYGGDATVPVTRPGDQIDQTATVGGGGAPGGGDPTGGDDENDPRRLWLIIGSVLLGGLIIGALIAVIAGGGDDNKRHRALVLRSTSTSSTSTTSTSTSTSTTAATTPAPGPQILTFTTSTSNVTCGPAFPGFITLSWATANTTGVSINLDGGLYGDYGVTDNQQVSFSCPAQSSTEAQSFSHTYTLIAHGTNGQNVQQQKTVSGFQPIGP